MLHSTKTTFVKQKKASKLSFCVIYLLNPFFLACCSHTRIVRFCPVSIWYEWKLDIYGDLADGLMRGKIAITLQKSGRGLTLDGQFHLKKNPRCLWVALIQRWVTSSFMPTKPTCPLFICQSLLVSFNLWPLFLFLWAVWLHSSPMT